MAATSTNSYNTPSLTSTTAASMRIMISLNEKDIIKMILEFLNNRDLYISMLDLERETGI